MTPAIVVFCGFWALADGAETCGPGDAQMHIASGHERSDHGDEMGALAAFRCAYRLGGSAEALAQIGLAKMALGRWLEAEADLGKALAQAQDPWIRQRRAPLEAALEKVRDNLGDLLVEGSPPGAEILINGRKAARLPLAMPLRVPTGRVDIHMRAEGYQSVSRERRIEPRALARETIELVPIMRPPPPPPPRLASEPAAPLPSNGDRPGQVAAVPIVEQRTAGPSRWPAWVAASGSLLALGGGIAFHVVREQRARDFNARADCSNLPLNQDCSGLSEEAKRAERLAIVAYAGAALLAATSVYLFVSSPGSNGAGTTHAFSCGAQPGVFAISCAGRF